MRHKFETKFHSVECFVVIIICCMGAIKIKDSVEQIYALDAPGEVSVTFDPEISLRSVLFCSQ